MHEAGPEEIKNRIIQSGFESVALDIFRYQSLNNKVYSDYLEHLGVQSSNIQNYGEIPFLPIEFFKTHQVKTWEYQEEKIFESSGTGASGISRNYVRNLGDYLSNAGDCFSRIFGKTETFCHLALLPSYLEKGNSSLVSQVESFIRSSLYTSSSFYLYGHQELYEQLIKNEAENIPSILWGVSYALLDFAEKFQVPLKHTIIIETGGMKGRRKEMIREELHKVLKSAFSIERVAGEYGMTELMSQAYAMKDGIFICPGWMRVECRELNDPMGRPMTGRTGVLNICDLANLHSCAFIQTADLGRVHDNGSFEVMGRVDFSDERGCNLML